MLKNLVASIINSGVNDTRSDDEKEIIRLMNAISLLGVPVSASYILIFSIEQNWEMVLAFVAGLGIFLLPPLLNRTVSLDLSRWLTVSFIPGFFFVISLLTGESAGFHYGLIVVAIPPLAFYVRPARAVPLVLLPATMLVIALVSYPHLEPQIYVEHAKLISRFNLFTILVTAVAVIYLFKVELVKSRIVLQVKNKEVMDSIHYARRIQNSMLPDMDGVSKSFKEHFIIYRPKDIVSGDFYWCWDGGRISYIAAADCTGHGVPGAFMSMLGSSFLDHIVIEEKVVLPNEILQRLDERITQQLNKGETTSNDGMDIALLAHNRYSNELLFAGANNPMLVVQNGEMAVFRGSRSGIGGQGEKAFDLHRVKVEGPTWVYIFSDGFQDQFGGPKGKKYKIKQLRELILEVHAEPMNAQLTKLEKALDDWMDAGNFEQMDDILLIGLYLEPKSNQFFF